MSDHLSPGDLLFLRDRGWGASLIRFWSRRGAPPGHPDGFNHVAMYAGADGWISAEPSGIRVVSYATLTRHAVEAVVLSFTGPPRVGFWAAQEAMAHVGQDYDFLGVVGFGIHRLTGIYVHWGARLFCSELCLRAWIMALAEAGLPHAYRDPSDTTPNDCFRWARATDYFDYFRPL